MPETVREGLRPASDVGGLIGEEGRKNEEQESGDQRSEVRRQKSVRDAECGVGKARHGSG